ncbi:MAG TPA: PDZ domain-containing protein, partial [Gemmataceae bacterium]|nr:PDZ domain-containing protein [Gemmataceae bacterium]
MHSLRSGVMALLVVASVGLLSWAQQPDPRQQPDPNSQPNPKTQLPPTFQPGTNPQQPGQPPAGGGYLGVMLNPEAQPGANGIEVMQVMPDSPAAKVGLQNGDRITKVGDKQVTDVNQFLQTIGSHKPGDKFTVVVMRGGKEQNIAVTVGQRPANMGYGMQQPGSFPQFPNTYPQ